MGDLAPGDGAVDFRGRIKEYFAVASFEDDRSVDDGPAFQLEDLLGFECGVAADRDAGKLAVGKEGLLPRKVNGVGKGRVGGLERADHIDRSLKSGTLQLHDALGVDFVEMGRLSDEVSRHLQKLRDGRFIEFNGAQNFERFEGHLAERIRTDFDGRRRYQQSREGGN
jgi:hypothetical protein